MPGTRVEQNERRPPRHGEKGQRENDDERAFQKASLPGDSRAAIAAAGAADQARLDLRDRRVTQLAVRRAAPGQRRATPPCTRLRLLPRAALRLVLAVRFVEAAGLRGAVAQRRDHGCLGVRLVAFQTGRRLAHRYQDVIVRPVKP